MRKHKLINNIGNLILIIQFNKHTWHSHSHAPVFVSQFYLLLIITQFYELIKIKTNITEVLPLQMDLCPHYHIHLFTEWIWQQQHIHKMRFMRGRTFTMTWKWMWQVARTMNDRYEQMKRQSAWHITKRVYSLSCWLWSVDSTPTESEEF